MMTFRCTVPVYSNVHAVSLDFVAVLVNTFGHYASVFNGTARMLVGKDIQAWCLLLSQFYVCRFVQAFSLLRLVFFRVFGSWMQRLCLRFPRVCRKYRGPLSCGVDVIFDLGRRVV
jgi:hypothetical protein